MPGDLAKISSFGTNDKKIILIDAGLNKKVYQEHYES
jgi:hypothetical protein